MRQQPYLLDAICRQVTLQSLQELCSRCGWTLWAAHVRSNHVHVVATASCKPEQVMNAMKAHSSRALNRYGFDNPDRRRWARHGSTRYLWTEDAVRAAIQYVVYEQGEPMQCLRCHLVSARFLYAPANFHRKQEVHRLLARAVLLVLLYYR